MRIITTVLTILFILSVNVARAEENATTKQVEAYLNTIKTMQADFAQTQSNGKASSGKFMLKRPGKLRFEYAPPSGDFIVADGFFIHFYDAQMKQSSSTPIKSSLANFFLRDKIVVADDIVVDSLIEDDKSIEVTVYKKDEKASGTLTLFLHKNPMQLYKWKVSDASGITTEIELKNIQEGVKLDKNIFFYYDPNAKKSNINN